MMYLTRMILNKILILIILQLFSDIRLLRAITMRYSTPLQLDSAVEGVPDFLEGWRRKGDEKEKMGTALIKRLALG